MDSGVRRPDAVRGTASTSNRYDPATLPAADPRVQANPSDSVISVQGVSKTYASGQVALRPTNTVVGGIAFGDPYQSPFSVR